MAGGCSAPAASGTIVSTPTTVASVGLVSTASRANCSQGAISLVPAVSNRNTTSDSSARSVPVRCRPASIVTV